MDQQEKDLLDNLKNFDTNNLFQKDTYVEIILQDAIRTGYILECRENDRYDISFIYTDNQPKYKENIPGRALNYYGENYRTYRNEERDCIFSRDFQDRDIKGIYDLILAKSKKLNFNFVKQNKKQSGNNNSSSKVSKVTIQDKNGKLIDINGYLTYQFLAGFIPDCFNFVKNELRMTRNLEDSLHKLLCVLLDIVIYVEETVKNNIKKFKSVANNRKLIIVSQIHAILMSFDPLLMSFLFIYHYNFQNINEINYKLNQIAHLIYEIIISSKGSFSIPFQSLIFFIEAVTFQGVLQKINTFNRKDIYDIFKGHISNLNENELKNIKSINLIKCYCSKIVELIFNKEMDTLIWDAFYSFLLCCLKCKNLEKKMAALNEISDIINELTLNNNKNNFIFINFIEKNKILNIFFEDSIHDEVIKRSSNLFKYLAMSGHLNDDVIEKLIQRQNNDSIKNILTEVALELPRDKKDMLFKRLTENIKLESNNTNIKYVSKLTESCFNDSTKVAEEKQQNELLKKQKGNGDKDKKNNNSINNSINNNINNSSNNNNSNNYYGLNLLFDYITKYFSDNKKYNDNNVDQAIDSFEQVVPKLNNFNIDDAFFFLDKLFDNIRGNPKHNSVVQSIKLIRKLFNRFKKNNKIKEYVKKLDEKYDIITLIVNDLVKYMNSIPKNIENIDKEGYYEGIYPHSINVKQRLNLIFDFYKKDVNNYGIVIQGKKHIEKIYKIFNSNPRFSNELLCFYEILTRYLDYIDNDVLNEFFKDILQNESEFDVSNFSDNESIILITRTFIRINENSKNFLYDGKTYRVAGPNLVGFDTIFDVLTKNKNKKVQNQMSQLLCDICLNIKDFRSDFLPSYWKMFDDKINLIISDINKTHDPIALSGIIKLINNIYSASINSSGTIPGKGEYKILRDQFELYFFEYFKNNDAKNNNNNTNINNGNNENKKYKLRVGYKDKLIELRWKLGYYFDIPVNEVCFIDCNNNIYTLNDDFSTFMDLFPVSKYQYEKGSFNVKVSNAPGHLLKLKDNPKVLIENNEKIFKLLIDNLFIGNNNNSDNDENYETKQKIWNIISKLPKTYYFENKVKRYGNKEPIKENELLEIFNFKEIYIFTYSLECINYFIFLNNNNSNNNSNNNNYKDEFLNNFINIHHGDKLIYNILLNIKLNPKNYKPIHIECLGVIIEILYSIEKYKENLKTNNNNNKRNRKQSTDNENDSKNKKDNSENTNTTTDNNNNNNNINNNDLLKQLSEIISDLLELDYDKYKSNELINDNIYDPIANSNINNINTTIAELVGKILTFIDEITKDNTSYMQYIFKNIDLFKKIFVYDYIKCETDESRNTINQYLTSKLFENQDYIKKYFQITLTVDLFNFLVKNDKAGKYFHVLSSIMKKYFDDNVTYKIDKENDINLNECKKIIDSVLLFIQQECEKEVIDVDIFCPSEKEIKNNNVTKSNRMLWAELMNEENFKEGIILFLTNVINIKAKDLVDYILTKIDIFDLFLTKCILRKCTKKPLETKNALCRTNQSQEAVFKLIIFILRNLNTNNKNDIFGKIISELDKIHKIGFWKNYSVKNWELDSRDMQKGKYVGLKNMTSTCYLNSIIQQLFMIPMLRETILKINNPSHENILYQLQLLFSALKIYEFAYYDPRSFVIANGLNFYEQMDADEFYGTLIDKIENDIKEIYSNKNKDKDKEESNIKDTIISNSTMATSKDNNTNNKQEEKSYPYKDIFSYFFGIKVLDELKFVDCGHKRYNEFFYNSIQLEVKGFTNIYDSLKNYFKTEVMDGDNKINCEECKIKRKCHKHLTFKTLPNILVIALKRFEFDYNTMLKYKLNNYFEFPFELDMKDYLIDNETKNANTEYELTGITIHFGISDFGHYYDLIKGPDSKWYKFNDISVSEFKVEDIPREAFGEKDIDEEDSSKEKESGKNNAYILIYKKKNFDMDSIDKIKTQINNKNDLAYPPYNRYSNINNDIKSDINFTLFKSWTLKNILSSAYQNFILDLIKIDLVKHTNRQQLETDHPVLYKNLVIEGYYLNASNNSFNKINNNINNNNDNGGNNNNNININGGNNKNFPADSIPVNDNDNNIDDDGTIFQFGLRYYFNVVLRIRRIEKSNNQIKVSPFYEIICAYIESDIKKAKFLLEEFGDENAINEYLVYCPCQESVKECLQLIMTAFNYINLSQINSQEKTILNEFINSLVVFINKYIIQYSLDNVNNLFISIIRSDNKFINYLKRKNLDKWVKSFIRGNEDDEETDERDLKKIINDSTFPKLVSKHSILIEKNMKFNESGNNNNLSDGNDIYDQHFFNKLKDNRSNSKLIEELRQDLLVQ